MDIFADIEQNNIANVRSYLANNGDVNLKNKKDQTLLMYAAKLNRADIVQLLLTYKADIKLNDGEPYYWTALYYAVKANKQGSHNQIIDKLYQPEIFSIEDRNIALLHYAKTGNLERVKECLEKYHCDINFNDMNLGTPLIAAAANNQLHILQTLLSYTHLDINLTDDFNNSALIAAARMGHSEVVKLLLKQPKINLHTQSYLYGTALTAAIWEGHTEIIKILLKKEDKFEDKNHPAALTFAVRKDNVEIAKLLLDNGANINSTGELGYILPPGWIESGPYTTPFLCREMVTFELPLTIALKDEKLNVLPLLLERGADFNQKGTFGKTPNDVSISDEIKEIIANYKNNSPTINNPSVSPTNLTFFPSSAAVPVTHETSNELIENVDKLKLFNEIIKFAKVLSAWNGKIVINDHEFAALKELSTEKLPDNIFPSTSFSQQHEPSKAAASLDTTKMPPLKM